jgi:DNA-binding GntR family transcriptional regulator
MGASGNPVLPALTLTRSSAVAEELRRLILSGELPLGSRLRQAELAARFGVSTTPVREAFTALAKEGLVRQDAQRGAVVFTPTVADVQENYEIRLALEPLATELAASNITDAELAHLDGIVAKMRDTEHGLAYQPLNRAFHFTIYASARRQRLLEIIESLRDVFEAYVALDVTARPDPIYDDAVQQQHEAIAEAMHARAPKRARKLMHDHLESNRRHIATSVAIVRGDQR